MTEENEKDIIIINFRNINKRSFDCLLNYKRKIFLRDYNLNLQMLPKWSDELIGNDPSYARMKTVGYNSIY